MTIPLERPIPETRARLSLAEEAPARVLFVINALGAGGAERQLVTLASGLDRSRFVPEVAVLARGGRLEAELAARGVPLRVFARRGRLDLSLLPALVRHARGFDVVHAWLTPGVLYGLLAARLARVPVAVGSERGSPYERPSRLHGGLLRAEGRLLAGCSGVIANSRAGAAFATARGVPLERLHVVYNALPEAWPPPLRAPEAVRRALGLDARAVVLCAAASLRPKKDHATLLEAIAQLARRGLRPVLLLAGDGPLRDPIARRAEALGIAAQVHMLGDRSDVADLLRASDIAVLSSKEREGCPNVLMEAMSLGVPVVATDAGGTREVVEDGRTGTLVAPRDAEALAGALERMITDPRRRAVLAEAARHEASVRFTNARMVGETEALYAEWLDRAGARRAGGAARRTAARWRRA